MHFYLVTELQILRNPLPYYFLSLLGHADHVAESCPTLPASLTPGLAARLPCLSEGLYRSFPFTVLFRPQPYMSVLPGTHCPVFLCLLSLGNLTPNHIASTTKFTKILIQSTHSLTHQIQARPQLCSSCRGDIRELKTERVLPSWTL